VIKSQDFKHRLSSSCGGKSDILASRAAGQQSRTP
jgi:hypothetical protein